MAAGDMEAAEVVQMFVVPSPALLQAASSSNLPKKALKGFARVVVQPGQHQIVELPLGSKDFQFASSGMKLSYTRLEADQHCLGWCCDGSACSAFKHGAICTWCCLFRSACGAVEKSVVAT